LRVQEALALAEAELDQRRGAVLVRRGKGGRRREVGMDPWGWTELEPWLEVRVPTGYENTGVELLTAEPVKGVPCNDEAFGVRNCWG
jgi:site-specific recombinase XerC